jgi:predicted phosphate transport protein (TIGR00153 family)
MNLNKIFQFLTPKNPIFFPLFNGQAKCIVEATQLLVGIMSVKTDEERLDFVKRIKSIESEGDSVASKLNTALVKEFIVPFDKEDIHELSSKLDDVLDNIYAVSQRIQWYKPKPKKMSPEMLGFIEVITEMSKEIETVVSLLDHIIDNKTPIAESCKKLNNLEKKADIFFYTHMSQLFENEKNLVEIIKDKDIFHSLEKTANSAEDIANIIKTILIKNI